MSLPGNEREEMRRTFFDYARTRDQHLRDQLVAAHLPLAEYLARRFANRGEPLDDLIQVASLALLKAVERFDPDRGLEFSTFATPTVVGELKRHFRDKGWAVRVPRRVQELHLHLGAVVSSLSQELGRSPTIAEIAHEAGASDEEVLEAMEAGRAYRLGSIDAPRAGDGGDGDDGGGLAGRLGSDDPGIGHVEVRMELSPLLASLPERERMILHLRFFEGLTQSEIATRLDISQVHVSRLLARSLQQLRQQGAAAEAPS